MATSRVDAVLDALKSTFSAAAGLSGVTVHDGPALNHENATDLVWVGHSGEQDDSGGPAVRTTQDWVGLGTNNRRDERIDVTCSVLTWYGDQDVALTRARVYTLLEACENAILSNVTLGVGTQGTPGSVRNTFISETELHQFNNAGGARARVVFTVSCIARL